MSTGGLTTTSYAILGLLAIRPWTTYELAQQMDRSLKRFWPRAQSRIYVEPKRLASQGLADARRELVGRRPRTVYSISDQGRFALRTWLAQPGSGPVVEFEALLKVFFAEHGRPADALANVEAIRQWAQRQNAENVAFARMYLDSGGPFPQRLAQITLTGKFIADFADMVATWSVWATETIGSWPDEGPAEPPWEALRTIAARSVDLPALPPQRPRHPA